MNSVLAYETGVFIGDGNLYVNDRMNRVTYSGNLENEEEFYEKVLSSILEQAYGIQPRIYRRVSDNSVLLVINSKRIVQQKINIGFRPGNKREIRIPESIRNDDECLRKCLSGIGDTDFSLSFKKNRKGVHTEPRLELFTFSPNLAKDIQQALIKLGFSCSFETKERRGYQEFRIRMYGKKNLDKWLREIGFKNPYILAKLNFWRKFGYFVPRKNYTFYASKSASPSG